MSGLIVKKLLLTASVGTETARQFDWRSAVRFFAFFLLMIAIIYGILHLTRWIGKKWGKH